MSERRGADYFGAGPALLPDEVVLAAAKDFVNYSDLGIGVAEMSHRSSQATAIINETKSNLTRLVDLPDTHEIFFVQGGGTGGFSAIPYNMMAHYAYKTGKKGKADYIVTGAWSAKAAEEAERLGFEVNIVANSKDHKTDENGKKVYGAMPAAEHYKFGNPTETAYVYYCDNETVAGVEFPDIPKVPEGVELVADMSSNFLSRKIDVSRFGLIFGGAQKNIGVAGIAFYIIKKELLKRTESVRDTLALGVPTTPILLDFPSIIANNSAYNTIPIFAVDVINHYLKYLLAKGGLEEQQKESNQKAALFYTTLESCPSDYKLLVDRNARSRMNIVFRINGDGNEAKFLEQASQQGLTGLKGHRSVGGIRISNYNAVTMKSAQKLADFLKAFGK